MAEVGWKQAEGKTKGQGLIALDLSCLCFENW